MIYITHRLTEVFEIATDVAIMRDGLITLSGPVQDFTKEMLIQGLLPTDVEVSQSGHRAYQPVDYENTKPVLQVRNFSATASATSASISIPARSWGSRAWWAPAAPR